MPWDACLESITDPQTGNVTQVPTLQCIPIVFHNIVSGALMFAGAVALFMIVYAGIRYITSRGDPKAVEGARNTLTWAIIGLIIILVSFTIINFVGYFTGTTCINMFGFSSCPIP